MPCPLCTHPLTGSFCSSCKRPIVPTPTGRAPLTVVWVFAMVGLTLIGCAVLGLLDNEDVGIPLVFSGFIGMGTGLLAEGILSLGTGLARVKGQLKIGFGARFAGVLFTGLGGALVYVGVIGVGYVLGQ